MIKRIFISVLVISLSAVLCSGQINPYYTIKQQNAASLYNNNFEVANDVAAGETYDPTYPAYTTFMVDGYVLENIPASKHIQGLPIGFTFPYAGQEFDIYTVNAKGYIVLGKSSEGGMTVYADTLIETAADTVFTAKNKYLISGLYAGKDMDFQGSVSFQVYKGGFEGERRLFIVQSSSKAVAGGSIIITGNIFELKQTGEINIRSHVQILFNSTNNNLRSYGTFMQRYGTDYANYVYAAGDMTASWFHTLQSFNNTDYKYGILRDTVKTDLVSVYPYTISYYPKESNFDCPVAMRWNPNPPGGYSDSAYIANDYQKLSGDTLATTDRIWWYSDMRDSLRFDVYLGTDDVSMERYKTGLVAYTINNRLNYIAGLVNLSLDSLASGQKYFMKIHTIHPSMDTVICSGYSFYTKSKEEIKNYCRSEEPNGGSGGGFAFANMDLNTLHFHPDSLDIVPGLEYASVLPDTGSWTTTLQQGQSYLLQLSTASWLDLPATFYIASVFIDYNGDGHFDSPANNNDNHTYGISKTLYKALTIDIPMNAAPGKRRLRVMVRAYGNNIPFPDACEKDAMVADFIITIAQAPGCNLSYSDTIVSPSCASYSNGSLSIIPEGGTAPYKIQWNTGNPKDTLFTLSDLASPARHRATITDAAGCNIRTEMLQMTQPVPLNIDTFFQSVPQFIVFNGGTKPYRATITGGITETRYAVNDTIFLTDLFEAGNYSIQATDSNSCDVQEYKIKQTALGIINNVANENPVTLYPNPATHQIHISGINTHAAISIYGMEGKKIFEGICINHQLINTAHLPAGLYVIKIQEVNRTHTIKLIIQ